MTLLSKVIRDGFLLSCHLFYSFCGVALVGMVGADSPAHREREVGGEQFKGCDLETAPIPPTHTPQNVDTARPQPWVSLRECNLQLGSLEPHTNWEGVFY